MRYPKLVALSAATVLVFAACGSSGAAPGATATPIKPPIGATAPPTAATVPTAPPVGATVDTCTLLTGAEVKAATGKNYGEGYPDPDLPGYCQWNTNGATVNNGDLITGYVQTAGLDTFRIQTGSVDVTVNAHPAIWNPKQGLNSMWVDIGGGRVFALSFPRSEDLDASTQAIAQKLAEIAVGRI